jgi:hypothetical protein
MTANLFIGLSSWNTTALSSTISILNVHYHSECALHCNLTSNIQEDQTSMCLSCEAISHTAINSATSTWMTPWPYCMLLQQTLSFIHIFNRKKSLQTHIMCRDFMGPSWKAWILREISKVIHIRSELSSGIYCHVKWSLMMEAVRTSETSVDNHFTLQYRSTIILHGSISQKTTLNIILAAVRTWNLTQFTFHDKH